MQYLLKVYLFFDVIFVLLASLYWFYYLKSKKPYYFYISMGSILLLLFTPVIVSVNETQLNFWSIFFLFPGIIMLFTGMIWRRIENPKVFLHFTRLSELPDNRNVPYRKDLLIYGLIFYVSGVIGVLIYKRIDSLTSSAALIGSIVLFLAPLKFASSHIRSAAAHKS